MAGRSSTSLLLILSLILMIAFADLAQIANRDVRIGARQHRTRSHVCSSAKNVALNACACQLAFMETNSRVLATTTGRLRRANQSVLDFYVLKRRHPWKTGSKPRKLRTRSANTCGHRRVDGRWIGQSNGANIPTTIPPMVLKERKVCDLLQSYTPPVFGVPSLIINLFDPNNTVNPYQNIVCEAHAAEFLNNYDYPDHQKMHGCVCRNRKGSCCNMNFHTMSVDRSFNSVSKITSNYQGNEMVDLKSPYMQVFDQIIPLEWTDSSTSCSRSSTLNGDQVEPRLQEEKVTLHIEYIRNQRMMDEQAEHGHEVLQLLNELVMKLKKDKFELENELDRKTQRESFTH
ncbi:hypothetical protein E3N88_01647 [Mikania micrantha]|uniref:GTD-binding domain-containing protein n=1 Tax=Mikania micrantha TaxID=192012 RepID=A0A5N6Q3G3_9ASTR|nr:hypothetical protein E3N88_01647 [Mikania micrantha]